MPPAGFPAAPQDSVPAAAVSSWYGPAALLPPAGPTAFPDALPAPPPDCIPAFCGGKDVPGQGSARPPASPAPYRQNEEPWLRCKNQDIPVYFYILPPPWNDVRPHYNSAVPRRNQMSVCGVRSPGSIPYAHRIPLFRIFCMWEPSPEIISLCRTGRSVHPPAAQCLRRPDSGAGRKAPEALSQTTPKPTIRTLKNALWYL